MTVRGSPPEGSRAQYFLCGEGYWTSPLRRRRAITSEAPPMPRAPTAAMPLPRRSAPVMGSEPGTVVVVPPPWLPCSYCCSNSGLAVACATAGYLQCGRAREQGSDGEGREGIAAHARDVRRAEGTARHERAAARCPAVGRHAGQTVQGRKFGQARQSAEAGLPGGSGVIRRTRAQARRVEGVTEGLPGRGRARPRRGGILESSAG